KKKKKICRCFAVAVVATHTHNNQPAPPLYLNPQQLNGSTSQSASDLPTSRVSLTLYRLIKLTPISLLITTKKSIKFWNSSISISASKKAGRTRISEGRSNKLTNPRNKWNNLRLIRHWRAGTCTC
ncbi:GSCOCG00003549001-RA-CDS, partial [Cotesia congregata]